MIQNLTALGVNIPDGFVVTVDAYYAYIKHNMLDQN
jgi:pyruvate,water dikinase